MCPFCTKGVERAFSFKLCDVLKTVLVVNYEHVMVGQNPDFTGIFSHIVKKHTKMGLINATRCGLLRANNSIR